MAHRNRGFTVFKEGEFSVRKSQTLSSPEAKNWIMGRCWYKATMRICMRNFSWCVWKMTDPKWPFYDNFTIWLFDLNINIAMENAHHKWRFLAGKNIYFYGPSIPWRTVSHNQREKWWSTRRFWGNQILFSTKQISQEFDGISTRIWYWVI